MADTASGAGYAAFISYRHLPRDAAVATALHRQLEAYRIPAAVRKTSGKKRVGKLFRDQDELPLMADLGEGIRLALEKSEWLIVVCSPELPKSKWCMAEIDYFIALGRRERILTVLADGEPEESFPHQLRFAPNADGGESEREPLAADVRAETPATCAKKVRREKLRLLAPMLGVGYDDLRRRQRERLLRSIAAASAVAAVVFALAGAYVLNQNRLLDSQRRQAMENEMALLASQSVVSTADMDRLQGLRYALQALQRSRQLYPGQDAPARLDEITQALEYATYTPSFGQLVTIKSNGQRITGLAFSPDDRLVLGIVGGNSAVMIDAATGEVLYTVRGSRENLSGAGFSPDGRHFYTACGLEGTATVWATGTGEQMGHYSAGSAFLGGLAGAGFLDDSRLLLQLPGAGTSPPSLLVWDYASDTAENMGVTDALTHTLLTSACALSPSGAHIAVPNELGGGIVIVETAAGLSRELESDGRGYQYLAFSPDGARLAGASGSFITVWDVESGGILARREAEPDDSGLLRGYGQPPLFSPDGSLLAACGSWGVAVLDAATLEPRFTLGEAGDTIYSAIFSPDSGLVAGICHGIRVHDTATGRLVSDMDGAEVSSATFSHSGARLLANTNEGANGLYATPASATVSVQNGRPSDIYRAPRWTDPSASVTLEGAHTYGDYLFGTPRMYGNGRYLAQAYPDGFIDVWDTGQGGATPAFSIAEHWLEISDMIVTDNLLASASMDGRILLVEPATGRLIQAVSLGGPVGQIELNAAGTLLVARTYAGDEAAVFSAISGRRLFGLPPEPGAAITDVGFTADGEQAVAVQNNGRYVEGRLFTTLAALEAQAERLLGAEEAGAAGGA